MGLIYNYSDYLPEFVTFERHLGQKVYTINYDVEEADEEAKEFGMLFRYYSVTLPAGKYDRSTVISTLIRQKYSDDEMQAIINNYLLDPKDEESLAEFDAMQEYRKHAKLIADEFLQAID